MVASRYRRPARSSSSRSWLVRLLLIVSIPAAVLLVVVAVRGAVPIPFLSDGTVLAFSRGGDGAEEGGNSGIPDNAVEIPLSTRAIPAYSAIDRSHYFDARGGRYLSTYLDKSTIDDSIVTMADVVSGKLNGRVLRRDKGAGYAFRWSEFMPVGTRPGVAAGIPPGKRGMWVQTDRILGLSDLQRGDRFDVVAARKVDAPPSAQALQAARASGALAAQVARQEELQRKRDHADVQLVVENGVLIVPPRIRQEPTTSNGLMSGQRVTTKPVLEAFLAVAPQELGALAAAMALESELRCAPRSAHAEQKADEPTELFVVDETEEDEAPEPTSLGVVDIIEGDQRRTVLVRRDPSSGQ